MASSSHPISPSTPPTHQVQCPITPPHRSSSLSDTIANLTLSNSVTPPHTADSAVVLDIPALSIRPLTSLTPPPTANSTHTPPTPTTSTPPAIPILTSQSTTPTYDKASHPALTKTIEGISPPIPNHPPLRDPETLGTLLTISPTLTHGLGVFALQTLPANSTLLLERPLLTLIDTGTRADPLITLLSSLPSPRRSSFYSLTYHSSHPTESKERSIIYSNGYSTQNDLATGIFEVGCRINHACGEMANCGYEWIEGVDRLGNFVEGEGKMRWFSKREILKGEEVVVDYGHAKRGLERIYGFVCECGGCRQ